jgi:hypothetical protein
VVEGEGGSACINDISRRMHVRVPRPAHPPIGTDPDLTIDHRALSWESVPAVAASVYSRFSPDELRRARAALHVHAAPLVHACDRLFGRTPPDAAKAPVQGGAWAAEVREAAAAYSAAADAGGAPWHADPAALYDRIPAAIAAAPTARAYDMTEDGYAVHAFAGNDDAEANGAMRNPVRWGMFAQVG